MPAWAAHMYILFLMIKYIAMSLVTDISRCYCISLFILALYIYYMLMYFAYVCDKGCTLQFLRYFGKFNLESLNNVKQVKWLIHEASVINAIDKWHRQINGRSYNSLRIPFTENILFSSFLPIEWYLTYVISIINLSIIICKIYIICVWKHEITPCLI